MPHLLSALTAMPTTPTTHPSAASPSPHKPKKPSSTAPSGATSHSLTAPCKHSPSATLDLLILILVLFSCAFLVTSSLSSLFHSLSLLLPPCPLPLPHLLAALAALALLVLAAAFGVCGGRSRRCANPKCKGLKKALEFDIQLQTEECLRGSGGKEIDELPWKGGSEGNPDYECFRAELRKMAPPSGRAVLLFRARCGCPVAKLEAWGNKRGRRHKKALSVLDGGGAHC